MDLLQLGAVWLHTVAFVIAWGYYGILGRMVLPALEGSTERASQSKIASAIERRALPFILGSIVIFIVTGSYLLLIDDRYAGLGNFFASQWTTLMLIKHLVIVVMVVVAVAYDRIVRGPDPDLGRARMAAEGATGLGALVALLTVAAQLSS